ncbi:MAG: YeeE/YedE family protein [Marinilabiliales bacterium]|nr:YeeE/YedE family protein [Marinilabiliales bacterium]
MSNTTSNERGRRYLNPYVGGVLLGLVLLAANFVSGRGLGASGAIKSVVATTIQTVDKDAVTTMPFMAEYAGSHSGSPMKSWLVFQMLGVIVGGFLSGAIAGRLKLKVEHSPKITSRRRLHFCAHGRSALWTGIADRARLHKRLGPERHGRALTRRLRNHDGHLRYRLRTGLFLQEKLDLTERRKQWDH